MAVKLGRGEGKDMLQREAKILYQLRGYGTRAPHNFSRSPIYAKLPARRCARSARMLLRGRVVRDGDATARRLAVGPSDGV